MSTAEPITPLIQRVGAPNPSYWTLDGTNSYVIRRPGSSGSVVVDPGPHSRAHRRALRAGGPVELILLTHHHHDHSDAAPALSWETGAPIRALSPLHSHGAENLRHNEIIRAGGCDIRVIATPGHTADSACFAVEEASTPGGAILTGDTLLGKGSPVIDEADGSLAEYLRSLAWLETEEAGLALPGHGPTARDVRELAASQIRHTTARLTAITQALRNLDIPAQADAATVEAVAGRLYGELLDPRRPAVLMMTAAHLQHLADEINSRALQRDASIS
ncbi:MULTISPECIES: MBL fold metallo-hydrolase [unclassified Microbacterium]|uniref:MBL fold metallo-hydrolase n=1 Tax=unclassified Microbacterium TaxID=2609290 RepID=UPI00214BC2C4|nr:MULTISPECIES: MBL fold metallo-hydrolase [unclassified Microbacterium]MCR2811324.1 MBL fold metallo-hydrolase [Microbacterium sp. zg.B185]WIM19481.1 MBL fold metallo-hydrolase [Microbacterium sp. zg-B185]